MPGDTIAPPRVQVKPRRKNLTGPARDGQYGEERTAAVDLEGISRRLQPHSDPDPLSRFEKAAVVVPLAERPEGLAVLLERRSPALRQSPGEVGFPGGRVESGENPLAAALRELEEELGIAGSQVRHLGPLPVFMRRRGELVYPFVCALDGGLDIRTSGEVAEAFWLPLERLRRHGFRRAELLEEYRLSRDFPSRLLPEGRWRRRARRPVPYHLFEGRVIWGLTAEILEELLRFL
jgi:coenzyme A diphosphatase NUDT7